MHKQWSLSNANYSAVSNVCFKLGISTVYPTPIYLPVHLILVNGDTLIQFQFRLQNVQFIKIAPIMNLITRPHHSGSLADLGGRARRTPPHLPGILVFDDILGHIALADLGGRARRAPPHLPGILVFDDILGHIV